ncbi:229_t:CDS:2, partial [Funneliformis mosseae]
MSKNNEIYEKPGFSYFITTPCEAWDALEYHEEWRASKLPMNKAKITTSLYKQLDWFENEGSEEEKKSAKRMLQQFKGAWGTTVPAHNGLGTDGCIYEFWTNAMAERHANLEEAKVTTKVRGLQSEQRLTFATVATKQMKHYALSTTRDDHVKQEIINSLVDHKYEIDDDFHSARTSGNKRKDVTDGDDTSSLSLTKKVAVETNVVKKNKINELFDNIRNRNIYVLCEPFRPLSETDAEDRFEMIAKNTTVEIDLPEDIKEYLHCLLSGDIKNALSKIEKPLNEGARPLMLWTRETATKKLGPTKRSIEFWIYFRCFFGNLTSGIALGEIVNEAHKDRVYNINADQKPSNSRRGDKNDAVLYQDNNATIIYEQSFGPTEFDTTHHMGDITKLARNGVDDLNYHFKQYEKSSITTAKKFKSVGIHGYKYFVAIYLTDLICMKTYRIYEIFKCKIPTSYTDRWFLAKIARIGVYLEIHLTERQFLKGQMGMEDAINDNGPNCVCNWMAIPDNTPEAKRTK